MRVLQVSDHYPPEAGGLAIQVQRLARRLEAAGHVAAVFTAGDRSRVELDGEIEVRRQRASLARLPVYQSGSPPYHPPWPDPEFRAGLAQMIKAFRPDVVHAHGWAVYSAASLTNRPPIVCSLHDYGMRCPKKSLLRHGAICATGVRPRCVTCDSEDQPTPRRTALAGAIGIGWPWLQRRVTTFLAVSSYVRERHLESGIAADQIRVVPPVIDGFPSGERRLRPDGRPYILYVGAGAEGNHKGRAVLLDAWQRIEHHGHVLELVGGRESVGEALADVEDEGYLRKEELAGVFRGASAAVVPSIWADPCPAVAVEALSAGVPVIASAIGGLTDIVQDDVTGILVAPGDPVALAGALTRIIEDPAGRDALGERARRGVDRYATSNVLPELVHEYELARRDG